MLAKNTFKKIGHSLGRFISLVCIIFIGVGFYAGIRQSTPAIRDVQNQYAMNNNMMDLHIVSTLGLTEDDIDELKKLTLVDDVTGGYSEYVYSGEDVIRVLSIDERIDRYWLCDGTVPLHNDECLAYKGTHKVGDRITVREPDTDDDSDDKDSDDKDSDDEDSDGYLKEKSFVVVGTVASPLYMGIDLGSAPIGNGELKSYILVNKDAFDMDSYSDVYVTFEKTEEDVPYSDSYDEKLKVLKDEVDKIKSEREDAREQELFVEARQKAYDEVEKKRDEIKAEVKTEVEKSVRTELEKKQEEQKEKLTKNAEKLGMTFEMLVSSLSDKVTNLLTPLTDEQVDKLVEEQLPDAEQTAIEEAKEEAVKKIEIPDSKWIVQTRDDIVTGYKTLREQYIEVESIADIIPLFFIVIVFLMTSNTMSRMIAEERGEMGTFTSLGISPGSIILSYMIYVLMATLVGVIGGYFVGVLFLPGFVFACFPLVVPDISFTFDYNMFIGSLGVSFGVMTIVTVISCMKELIHKPAYLLRPVPPKNGRRILLEYIKPLWNHLSFSWKISLRNFVRYKRRVFMTVVGVGGCTFLMFIGYALRDSINTIGNKQYSEILHYDVLAILDSDVKSFDDIETDGYKEREILNNNLVNPLMLRYESIKVKDEDDFTMDAFVVSPGDEERFEEYFTLRTADSKDTKRESSMEDGTPLTLSDEGVIITPRIAVKMDVGEGDIIKLMNDDGRIFRTKVVAITENYVANYIYMTPKMYQMTFAEVMKYNAVVALRGDKEAGTETGDEAHDENTADNESAADDDKKLSTEDEDEKLSAEDDEFVSQLYEVDSIVSVNMKNAVLKRANEGVKGLDGVVILLVTIACMLAVTVLYNLTSISISERIREIATLKVLGFTHNETNNYIYRETIISSILGIIIGLAISPYLHEMVLDVIGVDTMVFIREIRKESFLIAAGLSLAFTLVMMVVTWLKLWRVRMIESLKSVD